MIIDIAMMMIMTDIVVMMRMVMIIINDCNHINDDNKDMNTYENNVIYYHYSTNV